MEDMNKADEYAKNWRLKTTLVILYSHYNSLHELEDEWEAFNNMYRDKQIDSDWKSMDLYGKSNESRYREMKSKFLKQDIDDKIDQNVLYPHNKHQNLSMNAYQYATESDSCADNIIIRNKLRSLTEDISLDDPFVDLIDKRIQDKWGNSNQVYLQPIVPFFTPKELKNLGITYYGRTAYDAEPDNTLVGSISTKKWFNEYRNRFYGISKKNSIDEQTWSNTIRRLFNELNELRENYLNNTDSMSLEEINHAVRTKKQNILELGWNPEIPFDAKGIAFARNKMKTLCENKNHKVIDLSNEKERLRIEKDPKKGYSNLFYISLGKSGSKNMKDNSIKYINDKHQEKHGPNSYSSVSKQDMVVMSPSLESLKEDGIEYIPRGIECRVTLFKIPYDKVDEAKTYLESCNMDGVLIYKGPLNKFNENLYTGELTISDIVGNTSIRESYDYNAGKYTYSDIRKLYNRM